MDDLAIGRVFRQLRIRLGWTQSIAAAKARISTTSYSEIERGWIEQVPIGKLRRVAAIYEVRLVLEPRWRGAALDRAFSSRHAAMTEAVTQLLADAGWEVRPEVSFNWYGERGVVDLVGWHAAARTVLLIELKTELADINGLLTVTDRRRRLAARIVEPFGWQPAVVAQWLVLAEGRTNRRRVDEHRTVLRASFPADGRSLRGSLANPAKAVSALWFLPDSGESAARQARAPTLRVRTARASVCPSHKVAERRSQRCLARLRPSKMAE